MILRFLIHEKLDIRMEIAHNDSLDLNKIINENNYNKSRVYFHRIFRLVGCES